jgi:glutathione S-transferase
MIDREAEAALTALLRNLSDQDDPALADAAIELYLSRFGPDWAARSAALKRLTQAMLAAKDRPAAAEAEPQAGGRARLGPG